MTTTKIRPVKKISPELKERIYADNGKYLPSKTIMKPFKFTEDNTAKMLRQLQFLKGFKAGVELKHFELMNELKLQLEIAKNK